MKFTYCQSSIEGNKKCKSQCDHCKEYYKSLEDEISTTPKYRKIPIIITKWNDEVKGWRAEIADNYENYKTAAYEDINFEDLTFHFNHHIPTHPDDNLVFSTQKEAVEAAKYCNEKYLNNKAKIWFIH